MEQGKGPLIEGRLYDVAASLAASARAAPARCVGWLVILVALVIVAQDLLVALGGVTACGLCAQSRSSLFAVILAGAVAHALPRRFSVRLVCVCLMCTSLAYSTGVTRDAVSLESDAIRVLGSCRLRTAAEVFDVPATAENPGGKAALPCVAVPSYLGARPSEWTFAVLVFAVLVSAYAVFCEWTNFALARQFENGSYRRRG